MTTVDLEKRTAEYFVVVDDEGAFTSGADYFRRDRIAQRRVLHVERQADHPEEQEAQWDDLERARQEASESIKILTYPAVSHGRAAYFAIWEHGITMAAHRMAEEVNRHCGAPRGCIPDWIAIRITDGSSDGVRYIDAEDARAAQRHPDQCVVFPLIERRPMSVSECESFLRVMAHVQHGCCAYPGEPLSCGLGW
ncbi:hypothetical protein [Streptomyces palmae]|uniref:Uncharacterized protein n=1 Tax=Streptomyces palmae TaxID=1701085 RepID=A0A4Z0GYP6_9ACTN|nr:hypothetical protein [Streptomyces palmae]TGB01814.1 hypothetical protein E4099_20800 [Streptomyces palmae]